MVPNVTYIRFLVQMVQMWHLDNGAKRYIYKVLVQMVQMWHLDNGAKRYIYNVLFSIGNFFTTIILANFMRTIFEGLINPQKSDRLIAECSFLFIFFRPTFLCA